ncbi:hypothetical protein GUJ93_ZPchr0007g5570 [Zizania palustris]|uniref:Uncharacterized protein n=1 Tax=Zizania palustris TaxID=103762 RepID=A0A8J5T5X6_ZIZPA|nr:hypothetical protein GUJ93_ZPchr0007g4026 [Zizania palustris]KAG8080397.1 hypothetical protein GUJ93_ZPchr0007g5570 [Zizania palustris]
MVTAGKPTPGKPAHGQGTTTTGKLAHGQGATTAGKPSPGQGHGCDGEDDVRAALIRAIKPHVVALRNSMVQISLNIQPQRRRRDGHLEVNFPGEDPSSQAVRVAKTDVRKRPAAASNSASAPTAVNNATPRPSGHNAPKRPTVAGKCPLLMKKLEPEMRQTAKATPIGLPPPTRT